MAEATRTVTAPEGFDHYINFSRIIERLEEGHHTITRIDPEASAVAELLALGVGFDYEPGQGWKTWRESAPTAVELLAAVKAALKEATDAG